MVCMAYHNAHSLLSQYFKLCMLNLYVFNVVHIHMQVTCSFYARATWSTCPTATSSHLSVGRVPRTCCYTKCTNVHTTIYTTYLQRMGTRFWTARVPVLVGRWTLAPENLCCPKPLYLTCNNRLCCHRKQYSFPTSEIWCSCRAIAPAY